LDGIMHLAAGRSGILRSSLPDPLPAKKLAFLVLSSLTPSA
jgi:hypothetical protein